jgi:hypothetical protein
MNKISLTNEPERYENIFNVYELTNENNDSYVFYNILSKVSIPSDLDDSVFEYFIVQSEMPLTTLSNDIYKSQHLWWLIMAVNNIKNPVRLIAGGSKIKIIKPEYLENVLNSIKQKI